MTRLWPAPVASGPVRGSVSVPGSKSITNRALILAALSAGSSTITRPLVARDTSLMMAGLRSLGVGIAHSAHEVRVTPGPLTGPAEIDCGLAGTIMRFLPPLATLADGDVVFDGDEGARRRPLAETIESLRQLGAVIADEGRAALPFTVHGKGHLTGGAVTLDASRSSQFVSGLLLSGSRFDDGLVISHRGGALPSLPHIEMTVDMLRAAGAQVQSEIASPEHANWTVARGDLNLGNLAIEPDLSNASAFLAAAMVTAGTVTIPGWPRFTTQPGDQIRAVFSEMGASVALTDAGLTLTGPDRINGIDIDLRDIGELTPTVAAVAALADGPSTLRGIGHLRGHETDRLAALVREINRLGGAAEQTSDGITIAAKPLHGAELLTYHDHRMATFGAIIGLVVAGVQVQDIETTSKTLPDFVDQWQALVTGR